MDAKQYEADPFDTLSTAQVWAVFQRLLESGLADDPRLLGGGLDRLVEGHPDLLDRINTWLGVHHYMYQLGLDADGYVFASTVSGRDPQKTRQVRWPIVGCIIEELWVTEAVDASLVRFHIEQPVGPVVEVVVYGEVAAQNAAVRFGPRDWVGITGRFIGDTLYADRVDEAVPPS